MTNCNSIIGGIYYCLKEEPRNIFSNQSDFFDKLFHISEKNIKLNCFEKIYPDFFSRDFLAKSTRKKIENELLYKHAFVDNLRNLCFPLSNGQKRKIHAELIQIVQKADCYMEKQKTSNHVAKFVQYSEEMKRKLLGYMDIKDDANSLEYCLYLCIYLGTLHILPSNFYFGINYDKELQKFNQEVLCKYGITSVPGVRATIMLAQKGNIFALYERGDMEYYGRGIDKKIHLAEAFNYYKQAAGIDKTGMTDLTSCHPLALWSLSYILLNYKRRRELIHCETIEEIENLDEEERRKLIVKYAMLAIQINECAAAANVLGLFVKLTDQEVIREQFPKLESAQYYFQFAADRGYLYAYNNLAVYAADMIELGKLNRNEKEKYIKQYIENLEQAAQQLEPWAANRLGLLYLTRKILPNSQEYVLMSPNRREARKYFEIAAERYEDRNSARACQNLLSFFGEYYLDFEEHKIPLFLACINEYGDEVMQKQTRELMMKWKRDDTVNYTEELKHDR